jgi:flagellin-like protein
MKSLRKEGRRGVSPVIATLLLIVIAVAAAVLVYMWTVGYATQMRPTTPETGERLKIEAGKLSVSASPQLSLHVRNVGGSDVKIDKVYLLTTAQDVVDVQTPVSGTESISVGAVVEVKVSSFTGVQAGRTYIVRLVTTLGNEFSIELKAVP